MLSAWHGGHGVIRGALLWEKWGATETTRVGVGYAASCGHSRGYSLLNYVHPSLYVLFCCCETEHSCNRYIVKATACKLTGQGGVSEIPSVFITDSPHGIVYLLFPFCLCWVNSRVRWGSPQGHNSVSTSSWPKKKP